MLDIHFILENIDFLKSVIKNKNIQFDLDSFINLYQEKITLQKKLNQLQEKKNILAKAFQINKMEKKSIPASKQEEAKLLRKDIASLEKIYLDSNLLYQKQILQIPNIYLKDTPIGSSEKDNQFLRSWGSKRKFSFVPRTYMELAENLDMVDIASGVKISSKKHYFLKKAGSLLERALMNFVYDFLLKKGFIPYTVPLIVNKDVLYGTGYFPGNEDEAYYIEKDDQYLIGTSEVALCGYYKNHQFQKEELPVYMMSWSNCFRREAGSYGKKTSGLYRIHQFQKIEQVVIVPNNKEISEKVHYALLKNAEEIVQALGLPYRVMRICSGELGLGQVLKHDIEVWMESRQQYSETHSCSSFYDFQSRRLSMHYVNDSIPNQKKKSFVYTLNNTAIASPRILIPLIEHYQEEDASIKVPTVLIPYMNGLEKIQKT